MAFKIQGRVKGDKEVARALNAAPNMFFFELRTWLIAERQKVVGDKKQTKGYKKILRNRPIRARGRNKSGWRPSIVGLFKGHIPFAKKIGDLELSMGILGKGRGNQLQRAMEMLQTGGTITSSKLMPVPIWKNLIAAGAEGALHGGSARTGLFSKIFRSFNNAQSPGGGSRIVPIRSGSRVFFFDNLQRKRRAGKGRGGEFLQKGLLFIGMHRIRVRRQFKGRYDLYTRFDRMQNAIVKRGQTAVDRATRKVERKK